MLQVQKKELNARILFKTSDITYKNEGQDYIQQILFKIVKTKLRCFVSQDKMLPSVTLQKKFFLRL